MASGNRFRASAIYSSRIACEDFQYSRTPRAAMASSKESSWELELTSKMARIACWFVSKDFGSRCCLARRPA